MATPYRQSIKDWPEDERPRERLIKYGASSLSDGQILAIILGSGDSTSNMSAVDLARFMLNTLGSFKAMDTASVSELCQIKGVGTAKASQIKAAIELGKRLFAHPEESQIAFMSSEDVMRIYLPVLRNLKKEVFKCVLLDAKNKFLRDITISEGGLTGTAADPREIFGPVLKESAASVIFVHNHPSGDPTPSPQDIEVTERLVKTGDIMGIRVLDHIVIGDGKAVSFVDRGLMPAGD